MFQAITLRKGNVLVVSLIKQEMAEDATEDTVNYCMPNILATAYRILSIVYYQYRFYSQHSLYNLIQSIQSVSLPRY